MSKKINPNETFYALKYPDYPEWRDLDAAMRRGGFWQDGSPVRLSDPEMQPQMEEFEERIKVDPKFREKIIKGVLVPPRPKA